LKRHQRSVITVVAMRHYPRSTPCISFFKCRNVGDSNQLF